MAITATFTADFKSFYDAVQQSTVKLKDFQSNAETVARSVDKVANAFSGRKLVQDAEIMTKAITEIGGATALTAKEQAQVNAKLAEAIEKYQALGQVAPKAMQDLEQATRGATAETAKTSTGLKDIGGSLLKMASAVGIAFSAQAVIGFVTSVFDSASQIQDLSEKLGISAEAVQRFTYAAGQAGASIDDVGAALFKMNQKLAEGDKSTVHALTDLNLKLADLRQMSPEQAFLAITDALQTIENPMVRARLEVELFGKAGGAMGAAIAAGFREGGDAATVMANDTVKALADAQQAWENLGNYVVTVTGSMIAETAKAVQQITASWKGFATFVGTAMTQGVGVAATVASGTQTGINAAGSRTDVNLPGPVQAGAAELARLAREREAAARKAAAEQERLNAHTREYAKLLADDVVKAYEETRKALQRYYDLVGQTSDGINDGVAALHMRKEAEFPILEGAYGRWLKIWEITDKINSQLKLGLTGLPGTQISLESMTGGILGDIKKREAELARGAAFGKELAQRIIGGIQGGNLFASLGSMLGEQLGTALGGALAKAVGGKLGSMLGGMLGPLGALGGELIGKLGDKLFGKLFGKGQGRESVEAFAESMGGFDVLQKKLELLGEEGARLWVKLTQGTDKGNKEQAARNIKEVQDALDAYEATQEDVIGTTEEQARATIETASEAERAMKNLEPLLKANEDQWRAWGDVVNGQIDRVASALRSLALPNLSGAALAAPTSASGGGTAVINLDGRQIAEAVVPRIPGVVRRYGLA